MKEQWLQHALKLSRQEADFFSGARKIRRNVHFTLPDLDNDLVMADCGFTKSKMSMLVRNYLHEESRRVAVSLWKERLAKKKYGSVGFTTYNHFVKGDVGGHTLRGSKMGPCIQSVVITLLDDHKSSTIDLFYRTTELFKKFPADLVFLRDVLLEPFDFKKAPIKEVNFHFANVTCHPMYFVTLIPLLDFPIEALEGIRRSDKRFYDWVVKWTARYICPENYRGIAKFAQALRVKMDADKRINPKLMKQLQKYLRKNHPGYRNDYTDPEDEE